jgi:hypothetical protein
MTTGYRMDIVPGCSGGNASTTKFDYNLSHIHFQYKNNTSLAWTHAEIQPEFGHQGERAGESLHLTLPMGK